MRKFGLKPLICPEPRILILGSFPSVKSLQKKEYYANPSNHFWKLLEEVFGSKQLLQNYKTRLAFLRRHRIVLWDVIQSCVRKGSLDKNILDCRPNNISQLLESYHTIERIYLNGQKAEKCFQKFFPQILGKYLPCSSSLNTNKNKLIFWKKVLLLKRNKKSGT